jgi:uncharacterized protein YeaO (DUF488 family)
MRPLGQEWLKGVAPSAGLRRWFHAQPDRWSDFQRRYQAELEAAPDAWQPVLEAARRGKVTTWRVAGEACRLCSLQQRH